MDSSIQLLKPKVRFPINSRTTYKKRNILSRKKIQQRPASFKKILTDPKPNFGKEEIDIMTLLTGYELNQFPRCTSWSQATAAVNKGFQVCCAKQTNGTQYGSLNKVSSDSSSTLSYPIESQTELSHEQFSNVNVYYLERNLYHSSSSKNININTDRKRPLGSYYSQYTQPCIMTSLAQIQTKSSKSLVETKSCKFEDSEMCSTISHIQIGPRASCPIYGTSPCQGPACKDAQSRDPGPVKITEVFNPRREVLEIVIRKEMGGHVKNELMLEWTPPR